MTFWAWLERGAWDLGLMFAWGLALGLWLGAQIGAQLVVP